MRQPYYRDLQETSDGAAILVVSDQPLRAGQILVVHSIAGNHDNVATNEEVVLRITNGVNTITLHEGVPVVAGGYVCVVGPFVLSEGWYVQASLPNAANTEVMRLEINGELMSCDPPLQPGNN